MTIFRDNLTKNDLKYSINNSNITYNIRIIK